MADDITRDERERVRGLAMEATPGPWELDGNPITRSVWTENGSIPICDLACHVLRGASQRETDAAYLAACDPQTVSALLDLADRAEAAEAEVGRLKEALHMSYEGLINYHVLREDLAKISERDVMAETWDGHVAKSIAERDRLRTENAALREQNAALTARVTELQSMPVEMRAVRIRPTFPATED